MAFMDKLGQVAGKFGEVAGGTFDYGKAKGKIVLEKGRVKDAKEALGDYVFQARRADEAFDDVKIGQLCSEISHHLSEIAKLEEEAKKHGEDLTGIFTKADDETEDAFEEETEAAEACEASAEPADCENCAAEKAEAEEPKAE